MVSIKTIKRTKKKMQYTLLYSDRLKQNDVHKASNSKGYFLTAVANLGLVKLKIFYRLRTFEAYI